MTTVSRRQGLTPFDEDDMGGFADMRYVSGTFGSAR
jgi:hypothetical protein